MRGRVEAEQAPKHQLFPLNWSFVLMGRPPSSVFVRAARLLFMPVRLASVGSPLRFSCFLSSLLRLCKDKRQTDEGKHAKWEQTGKNNNTINLMTQIKVLFV